MNIEIWIDSRGKRAKYQLFRCEDGQLEWKKISGTTATDEPVFIYDGDPIKRIDVELIAWRGIDLFMPQTIPYEGSHLEPTHGN